MGSKSSKSSKSSNSSKSSKSLSSKSSKISLKIRKKSESSIFSNLSNNSNSSSSRDNSNASSTINEDLSNNPLYKYEEGRRYINDDSIQYPLPNDDEEIDRLQMQHYLLRYIWQSNFSAPVKEILNCGAEVLDVGCGPGTWILEMASDYPRSKFTGVDIAPIFPMEIKPVNSTFLVQNITHQLPFEDNTFDYIHMRLMLAVLRDEEWKDVVLPELFRILKPGGYIELHEFDFRIVNQGPCMKKLVNGFVKYCREKNLNPIICPHIPEYLNETEFTDIRVMTNTGHYATSTGRFGLLALEDFITVFKALKTPISATIEISQDEYLGLLDKLQEEVNCKKTFYKVYRFIGRKPF